MLELISYLPFMSGRIYNVLMLVFISALQIEDSISSVLHL